MPSWVRKAGVASCLHLEGTCSRVSDVGEASLSLSDLDADNPQWEDKSINLLLVESFDSKLTSTDCDNSGATDNDHKKRATSALIGQASCAAQCTSALIGQASCDAQRTTAQLDKYGSQHRPKSAAKLEPGCGEASLANKSETFGSRQICYGKLDGTLGWLQQYDCDEFRSKFEGNLTKFKLTNPRLTLCDYSSLSTEQQILEQRRVRFLLHRLGVRTISTDEKDSKGVLDKDLDLQENSVAQIKRPSKLIDDCVMAFGRDLAFGREHATSQVVHALTLSTKQFSPIMRDSLSRGSFCNHNTEAVSCLQCDRSVEGAREADCSSIFMQVYQSPRAQMRAKSNSTKRLASMSGKRGQDHHRTKLNLDPETLTDFDFTAMLHSWDLSEISTHVVSSQNKEAAHGYSVSSSSSNAGSHCGDSQEQRQGDRFFYENRGKSQSAYISRESKTEHRCRRPTDDQPSHEGRDYRNRIKSDRDGAKMVNWKNYSQSEGKNRDYLRPQERSECPLDPFDVTSVCNPLRHLRDISSGVGIKGGVTFHYNPLCIQRDERSKPTRFRDLLYGGLEEQKLLYVFDWVRERDTRAASRSSFVSPSDCKWNPESKGVVLSLDRNEVLKIIVQLLIESDLRQSNDEPSHKDDSCVRGETLVVVRTKEDAAFWEQVLREHTSFSVANHADLPCRDRHRAATASRFATYDIALTTYDSMKSPAISVQLDADGHARLGHDALTQTVGSWMTKRSLSQIQSSKHMASPAVCHQLSFLHCVRWRRIIFNDTLGRRCFLAKPETARAKAATALNGNARFVFFEKEPGVHKRSAFESLIVSDRRAVQSVASVIRIKCEDDEDMLNSLIDASECSTR